MTITNVSGTGSHFEVLGGDSFGGLSEDLAVLALESAESRKELDRKLLDTARAEHQDALAHEVQALRAQADAELKGAMFEGGMAIASGGLGVWGAGRNCEKPWQTAAAGGTSNLAKPLGGVISHNYGAADAKAAQGEEQAATWQLDDLRTDLADARQIQDKALDWYGSVLDKDEATTRAVLSNMR